MICNWPCESIVLTFIFFYENESSKGHMWICLLFLALEHCIGWRKPPPCLQTESYCLYSRSEFACPPCPAHLHTKKVFLISLLEDNRSLFVKHYVMFNCRSNCYELFNLLINCFTKHWFLTLHWCTGQYCSIVNIYYFIRLSFFVSETFPFLLSNILRSSCLSHKEFSFDVGSVHILKYSSTPCDYYVCRQL